MYVAWSSSSKHGLIWDLCLFIFTASVQDECTGLAEWTTSKYFRKSGRHVPVYTALGRLNRLGNKTTNFVCLGTTDERKPRVQDVPSTFFFLFGSQSLRSPVVPDSRPAPNLLWLGSHWLMYLGSLTPVKRSLLLFPKMEDLAAFENEEFDIDSELYRLRLFGKIDLQHCNGR